MEEGRAERTMKLGLERSEAAADCLGGWVGGWVGG